MVCISSPPAFVIHSMFVAPRMPQECVVCYEMTNECCMPCRHPMCMECSLKWFHKKTICPTCRQVPSSYCSSRVVLDGERDVLITSFPLGFAVCDQRDNVCVTKVVPRGAAAKTGIRSGDRIVHINDIPVQRQEDLMLIIRCNEVHATPVRLGIVSTPGKRWSLRSYFKMFK